MPDRRQVLRGLLLAGAGATLSGCGVPSGGPAIVDGTGPPYDPAGSQQQGKPPDPSTADSPTELVQLFLAAVSGQLDTPDLRTAARDRARRFLTDSAARAWQPSTDRVTVVRVNRITNTTSGRDAITVVVTLQPVGVLNPTRGEVEPSPDGPTGQLPAAEFTVVPADQGGYLIQTLPIDVLPPGLLLSSAALDEEYYVPQLIYFWDNPRRALVPDLRYVPRAGVQAGQQRADIVRWLIGGPSELISPVAANIMPEGTDLALPNVLTENSRLVVSLTGAFQSADLLPKVMSELRWSLQPLYPLGADPIQLEIASRPQQQVDGASAPYLADNPADADARYQDPQPFCVAGGQVYPVDAGYPVPPVLAESERYVVQAAVSRDGLQSAMVCNDSRMWFGAVNKAGGVTYTDSGLAGTRWSRPAFLPSGRRVLVVVDGVLYALPGANVAARVMDSVTAFAVSPDGYRIAVVARGGVAVGALRDTGDQLAIGSLRALDPGLTEPSGVAWTRLDRVVVSGRRPDGYGLAEVTIDGAIVIPWAENTPFKRPIASVVAYPKLPSQPAGSGPVLVQTDNAEAYRAFVASGSAPLHYQTPSPRPSPSGAPVATPPPTAPFYVD